MKDESSWNAFFSEALIEEQYIAEYARNFAINRLSMATIAELTDAQLKEIGITILGHRHKILRLVKQKGSKYFSMFLKVNLFMPCVYFTLNNLAC